MKKVKNINIIMLSDLLFLQPKKDLLARGFIIFRDSDIVQVSFKPEVWYGVYYSIAEGFLEYK